MSIKTHITISVILILVIIAAVVCYEKIQTSNVKKSLNSDNKTQVSEAKNLAPKIDSEIKNNESKIEETSANKEPVIKNLFVNSDFSDGLNSWNHDKGVNIIQDDGRNIVELIGSSESQTRIWQPVNTTSGHVYRLSLKIKSEQKIAFIIFRDYEKGTEKIHYLNPTQEWKEYKKDFTSLRDGNYGVFLSCKETGKFYYCDVSLVDITSTK